jgi:N-dimethylarginine dimethylaminohydrolase
MASDAEANHRYNMTIKMFGVAPEPAFETADEQEFVWGRRWGCDNDVGQIRVVLMHRPGDEMKIVDPSKTIDEIGAFGDPDRGWYWQSDTIPPLNEMQAQHDALAKALEAEGAEVVYLDGVGDGRLKSCYTRDSCIAVKGGAVVTRLAGRIRRGEELPVTRKLAEIGMPILRTIHGAGMMEGGSFAWLNSETAVVGRTIRVNDEGINQLRDVLAHQGVELLVIDMCGYSIHIDGGFCMIDRDLALVDAKQSPYWFLQKLGELGIRTIETNLDDNGWIINCLAVRPGRIIAPEGASARTLEALARSNVEIVTLPYHAMQLHGGGIHCSTSPLMRDPVD